MPYCSSCNRRFGDVNALNQHIQTASRHAKCTICQRGFESARQWQKHDFLTHRKTPKEESTGARSTSKSLNNQLGGLQLSIPSASAIYCGIPGSLVKPVFKAACRYRLNDPTPEMIIAEIKTGLDENIVAAIIEAAVRLNAPDNSLEGVERRRLKEAEKARNAQSAEASFIDVLARLDTGLLREHQQKARIRTAIENGHLDVVRATPDALFSGAITICGRSCRWLEYKNTFGFRSSPFVAASNKRQFLKYVANFGPGMVVFKLGYETDLIASEDVYCMREAEVLGWLLANQ